MLTDLRVESLYTEKRQPFGKKSKGMRHYGSKRKAEVLMLACSLPSLLGSCSAGPTDATRCCWEHTRPTSNPNPSHAAVQSQAGTQGRAASSRAPAQQRAPTAAGTARHGEAGASAGAGWLSWESGAESRIWSCSLPSRSPGQPPAATARREKP